MGKYVRLLAQDQSHLLYRVKRARKRVDGDELGKDGEDALFAQGNLSAVPDLENVDVEEFPLVSQAQYSEVILEAGDALYIPEGMWHFVRSLSVSFSVNFWF